MENKMAPDHESMIAAPESPVSGPEIAISVRNLSKKYRLYESPQHRLKEALHPFRKKYHRDFWALRNVSFDVGKGKTFGIIGKNGSGKSTLLQMICGVLQPSQGEVHVHGKISALLELGSGFNPEFTGRQNVYMNGAIKGFTREEMDNKFDEIASFADIGDFMDQPVKTYSSGMYVRLAFAAAVNVDPDILVVDEALSVGDMYFQAKCMKKMKQLMSQGCSTLFVSHSTDSVKSLCSRAVYLDDGIVKAMGDGGEMCDLYISDQRKRAGFFKDDGDNKKQNAHAAARKTFAPSKKEKQAFEKQASYLRKGEGDVKVIYASLLDEQGNETANVNFGQKLTFKAIYQSTVDLDELVFAFYVRNKNQLEVIGSNNVYEGGPITDIRAGEMYSVEFSFINRLRGGDYSINALIADSLDTTRFYDRIHGVVIFHSHDLPGERRWALVNPPMEFRHSRVGVEKEEVK
jgi:lipopolysaccharide transport system ATP-binding protein